MQLTDMTKAQLRELRAKALNSLRDPQDERYDYHGTQCLIAQIDSLLWPDRNTPTNPTAKLNLNTIPLATNSSK